MLIAGSEDQIITTWSEESLLGGSVKHPVEVIQGMGAPVDCLLSFDDVIASGSSNVR